MMKPDYSIIIPAYNEEELLPRTLESVRKAMGGVNGYTGEVIVTDNNSEDRTAEVAEQFGARVIFEEVRQIARSRNSGAKESEGKFLIFLDADTVLPREVLERTLETLSSGDYVGGGALPAFDSPQGRAADILMGTWRVISKTFRYAAGSYVFCLREAFESVGGFDERFYASEEIHLSRALKKWGRRRKLKMTILREEVFTSPRKLEWYSMWQLLGSFLVFVVKPWSITRREGCQMWYERPESGAAKKKKQ